MRLAMREMVELHESRILRQGCLVSLLEGVRAFLGHTL
jgi:hypothetical protein